MVCEARRVRVRVCLCASRKHRVRVTSALQDWHLLSTPPAGRLRCSGAVERCPIRRTQFQAKPSPALNIRRPARGHRRPPIPMTPIGSFAFARRDADHRDNALESGTSRTVNARQPDHSRSRAASAQHPRNIRAASVQHPCSIRATSAQHPFMIRSMGPCQHPGSLELRDPARFRIWRGYDADMARIRCGYGADTARIRRGCCTDAARIRCGCGSDAVWLSCCLGLIAFALCRSRRYVCSLRDAGSAALAAVGSPRPRL